MYGFHLSGSNLYTVIEEMDALNVNTVQIFIRNPRIKNSPITKYGQSKGVFARKGYNVFTHSVYGINLVLRGPAVKSSIASLIKEARFIRDIDGNSTVVHLGSTTQSKYSLSYEDVCKNTITNITSLRNRLYKEGIMDFRFALENQAICGHKIMTLVPEMIVMFMWLEANDLNKHIGFCFDTCHDFVSSTIDSERLGTPRRKVHDNLNLLIKGVGAKNIHCVHLNDSLKQHKDEHANLMEGQIPPEELMEAIRICKRNNIPMIVERIKTTREEKEKMIQIIKAVK